MSGCKQRKYTRGNNKNLQSKQSRERQSRERLHRMAAWIPYL